MYPRYDGDKPRRRFLLHSNQQQAVEFVTGPYLVLVGAGSGKTRVITNKIAHLIRSCGSQARHIAAVTFTNKASREMKERVAQTLGRAEARGLTVTTFHTLGLVIIKREYNALGMQAKFSLFDEQNQLALLKDFTEPWLEGDKDLLNQLTATISNWKNDLSGRLQCAGFRRFDLATHQATAARRGGARALAKPAVLSYLLMDEYQDTNTSQYELVKLLVGPRGRFTVVGDDDQSTYSWRSARTQIWRCCNRISRRSR